jgi:hypothetical protein
VDGWMGEWVDGWMSGWIEEWQTGGSAQLGASPHSCSTLEKMEGEGGDRFVFL